MTEKKQDTIEAWKDSVDSELYEELLGRYERILVFAGQLQERLNQQKLLEEKNQSLESEAKRLRQLVALDSSYIKLLEKSLHALGVLGPVEDEKRDR